jgi:hypothetical protein
MKHLDDGILQAWLDGPRSGLSPLERDGIELHLSECERCALRLRELEGESVLVDALLSGSEPEVEAIPPFDEILARARKGEAARRRRTGWTRAGWAATVAAAGVAGWMANGIYTTEVLDRDADASLVEAEAELDEGSGTRLTLEERAAPSTVASEPTVSEDAEAVSKTADAIEESRNVEPAPARVVVQGTGTDDTLAADIRLGESAVALEQLAVTAAPAESRAREAEAAAAGATQPTAEPSASADAFAMAPPPAWRSVSRAQAEAEAGFSILTVPDLPVVRIDVDSTGDRPLVRVLQEVEDGVLLEMVQGVGTRHALREIIPEGRSRVTALRGDVLVVAVAPVPGDVLDGLLQRLR